MAGTAPTINASAGGEHQLDRYFGVRSVKLVAAAEAANVIAVTATLIDTGGNTVASADAWIAEVVGELAAAFTLAETGAGAELGNTARSALAFTFSAAGVAEISVTDVVGASGDTVILAVRPADSFGVPNYLSVTFD